MAVPGYDMYYLNVMAGPGERRWLICDDPDHAWIRLTWDGHAARSPPALLRHPVLRVMEHGSSATATSRAP